MTIEEKAERFFVDNFEAQYRSAPHPDKVWRDAHEAYLTCLGGDSLTDRGQNAAFVWAIQQAEGYTCDCYMMVDECDCGADAVLTVGQR